jgi:hypothetical protein
MSIANLVNTSANPYARSLGPSPYSIDPGVSHSRLGPMSSPRTLPYPLMPSSSTGSSGIHRYNGGQYADLDGQSDSGDDSFESEEEEHGRNMDHGPQPQPRNRGEQIASEGSLAPSTSVSSSREPSG